MKEEFLKYILQKKLFSKGDSILAAVSGGIDSVVMLHLLVESGFKVGVAHCNFGLREKESDDDEKFVKALTGKLNIPFYSTHFDTRKMAVQKGISVQMAARDLRYKWLEDVRKKNKYDVVAIAHHADDSIETFFINLVRGTGIAGLHGIKAASGKIVRPLLFVSRKEIIDFAEKNKIRYREDSSNASDKYLRNKIRHHLVPLLEEMNPSVKDAVLKAADRINCTEEIMQKLVQEARKKMIKEKGGIVSIDITDLSKLQFPEFFLFEFMKPYGFSGDVVQNIMNAVDAHSGKVFYSATHRIVRDRKYFLITSRKTEQRKIIRISDDKKLLESPLKLEFSIKKKGENLSISKVQSAAYLDYEKLKFPLTLRKWKSGDFFHPFGMKGRKKISDFLTDLKLSLIEKENTWLMCSGKDIVWVLGYRIDNRYGITSSTKKIYIAEMLR